MVTTVLILLCTISVYIIFEAVKHSKLEQEDERISERCSSKSCKKRKVSKSSSKVSKAEAQNKRKPGRPKKQIKR